MAHESPSPENGRDACGCVPRNRMTKEESRALDILRFLLVACIVPLHCTVAHRMQAPSNAHVLQVQRLLCVPCLDILFLISGYLFFRGTAGVGPFWRVWKDKCIRRIGSLLVPYLVWSAVAIAWYASTRSFPDGHSIGSPAGLASLLVGWNGIFSHPVGFALWYTKSLMLFALLAPLYWCCFRALGRTSVIVALFLAAFPPVRIDWPFFNSWLFLGGSLAWNGASLSGLAGGARRKAILFLPLLAAWRIWDAFGAAPPPRFLDCIPVLAWLCVYDALLAGKFAHLLSRLAPVASFLYFSHVLFSKATLAVLLKLFFGGLISPTGGIVLFLARTAITLVASLSAFFFLRRTAPKLLRMLTGARC